MKSFPPPGLKILRTHFLGCVLLGALLVQGSVLNANAKTDTILDKQITIRFKSIALGEALDAIAGQARCSFSYSSTTLNINRKVTGNYTKTPLKDILSDLLKNDVGSIQANGNEVLLVPVAGRIDGKVVTEDGGLLPYTSIQIEGTAYGTTTREDGTFTLKVLMPGSCTLIVSSVGYETHKKTLQINSGQASAVIFTMKEATLQMHEVVVTADRAISNTATRTPTSVQDLPMPVLLIEGKQLEMMGSRRLNEVLQEQTGLALTTDPSGASNALGLQVQGFDASYTMIMIDGQPLIGRNSVGILDLSRITIANIERIEIIKGTSSALYGSDALAGVVNIITKKQSSEGIQGITTIRYGTNNTFDATLDGSRPLLKKNAAASVSANYYRTDGFDADPSTPGKTLPPFSSYALQGKLNYRITPLSLLSTSIRYASRNQRNRYDLDRLGQREDTNIEQDVTGTAMFNNRIGRKADLQTQYYFTQYVASSSSTDVKTKEVVNKNEFRQYFHRFESFANFSVTPSFKMTTGLGANAEILHASRYGNQREMQNAFAYVQADYRLKEKLGLLAGLRYDAHSIYGWQLSPRFGIRYTVNDWLILKGTAGTGFKAPSFQQLYLSFTNPSAGYTVLGASVFDQEVARMQAAGEIKNLYPIADQVGDLKAERSVSFNGGFMLMPTKAVTLEVNAFHNNISNMIFEELVGMKENGSQLYSYRNIEKAFTQGIETNVKWTVIDGLEISAGHQLLFAKDKGVIDEIKAGEKQVRTPEGSSRVARPSDYFNLTNRSRHMANVKVFYEYKPLVISASVRANYRGKYGMGDRNYPNNFIDPYDLYAEGYILLNATVEKRFFQKQLGVQLICDNLTDFQNTLIPNLAGRQFILSLSWRFEGRQEAIQ